MRDAAGWDARYAARGWLTEPSSTVVDALRDLPAGRALDLAAGTGRHALWLAGRGWQVTAVDFSAVGLEQGRAADVDGRVTWVCADVEAFEPEQPVDLVLAAYVQLGAAGLQRAARWLAPGGHLVVVGHALRNLTDGVHGPRDPAHLHTEQLLRDGAAGLQVRRLGEVLRPDDGGTVVELVLVAARPAAAVELGPVDPHGPGYVEQREARSAPPDPAAPPVAETDGDTRGFTTARLLATPPKDAPCPT